MPLTQQLYFGESMLRSKVAIYKDTEKRMFIGSLFVVAKITKQPEWNIAQVLERMGSTSVGPKGCSVCTAGWEKQAAEKLAYDDPILI